MYFAPATFGRGSGRLHCLEPPKTSDKTHELGPMDPKSLIENELNRFEKVLASLVGSVQQFNPNVGLADELIAADRRLNKAVAKIETNRELQSRRLSLQKVSEELDQQTTSLLLELADVRRTIQSTSVVEEETAEHSNKVNSKTLLAYATRITKFTRAPPNYNNQEHATLPWPTEDEMRKGMLALEDLLKQEKNKDSATDAQVAMANSQLSSQRKMVRRRSSLVEYGERPKMNPVSNGSGSGAIDLGLFDTDDEDA